MRVIQIEGDKYLKRHQWGARVLRRKKWAFIELQLCAGHSTDMCSFEPRPLFSSNGIFQESYHHYKANRGDKTSYYSLLILSHD